MTTRRQLAPALLALALAAATTAADPPQAAPETFLAQWARTRRFAAGRPNAVTLTPSGDAVLFLRSGPRDAVQDLYTLDARTGSERVLVTAQSLLVGASEQLTAEELARRERTRSTARGIASFALSDDGRRVLVPLSGRLFLLDRATGSVREVPANPHQGFALDPRLSPDGTKVACVRDGDLYVTDLASGRETRLTTRSATTVTNGLAEFVAAEEMGRHEGYWWSPDGTTLAYAEVDTAAVETFHILDPIDPSRTPQAWPYPRPGKANASVRLGFLTIPAPGSDNVPATTWAHWDAKRYPYLATVRWDRGGPPLILVQDRVQREELLLGVDPATGAATEILRESDAAWLNLDAKLPRRLASSGDILWSSERAGSYELELRDRTGKLIRTLGAARVNYRGGLLGVDEASGHVYIAGGEDPTERHVYRLPYRSRGKATRLTDEPGVHGGTWSHDGKRWVHHADLADGTMTWTLRGSDARKSLAALRSVAETPRVAPHVAPHVAPGFERTSVGGEPRFHALLVRPRDFVSGRKYPVIVHVYGGPHSQMVTAAGSRQVFSQWLADQGFVVVSIDGRGTPARGRAWERCIQGDLLETPLADQSFALRALGARYPELDLARVGIYGWSFGGTFAAMAALRRPELFQAAVAGAPVSDWRDYDTHYTERYLGLPEENPLGYQQSSLLVWARAGLDLAQTLDLPKDDLSRPPARPVTRPLLVIHGTADDNVYFLHALKLSDALFRAGRPYEFLPLAGFTHMVPEAQVTERLYGRIAAFFAEHLGVTSPASGGSAADAAAAAGASPFAGANAP